MPGFVIYVWRGDPRFAELHRFKVRQIATAVRIARYARSVGCSATFMHPGGD